MTETKSREFGVVPLETLRSLSGLAFLRELISGKFPAPPIAELLNFTLTEVDDGLAVFESTPSFAHYNPIGAVHGGYAATLMDSCMGCCVQTRLQAGQGYTTLELKVNLVRAITEKTGRVRAEGKVIHFGRQTATAEGRLIDSKGRLLAHGTTTCLIFDLPTG